MVSIHYPYVAMVHDDEDAVLNFMACHECMTRWLLGNGLFTGWMYDGLHDNREAWEARSLSFLDMYREIDADFPDWVQEAINRENERSVQRQRETG